MPHSYYTTISCLAFKHSLVLLYRCLRDTTSHIGHKQSYFLLPFLAFCTSSILRNFVYKNLYVVIFGIVSQETAPCCHSVDISLGVVQWRLQNGQSFRVSEFTGLDYWTGLLDWTTGLMNIIKIHFSLTLFFSFCISPTLAATNFW